jgi:TolB-like protein
LAVVLAALGDEPEGKPTVVRAVVVDFAAGGEDGMRMADSLRLKLRRNDGYDVLDRLTTQELQRRFANEGPVALAAAVAKVNDAQLVLWGRVERRGEQMSVTVEALDHRPGSQRARWDATFTDDTARWRAVAGKEIVELITGEAQWTPPQYGDEAEPEAFGKPLNGNGGFDDEGGWTAPDGVGIFITDGPKDRGKVLRIRTDLSREPYLAYRDALASGEVSADDPPEIATDTSYGCIGGIEGVHVRSTWIKAKPGQRYWLTADMTFIGGKAAEAKVFIKGFLDAPHLADGLHEQSLRERGLTPQTFAAMPEDERAELIKADAAAHPERYRRECYRWYLACGNTAKEWQHFAAPFPPRGGLPDNVQWLRIDIFTYWPPGEYLWDNVHLYADPRQAAPAAEEKPRTPKVRQEPREDK